MVRALCLMLAIVLAAGCKSPPRPSMDPFLGRATVPPPKPGAVVAQRTGDPYYPVTAVGTATNTVSTPPPPATATNRLTPPDGQWSTTPPPGAAPRAIDATARTPVRQQSYQQPVYPQPVYQPPVYQQPVYQQPVCPPCSRPARCASPDDAAPGSRLAPVNGSSVNCPPVNNCSPFSATSTARATGQPTLARPRLATESEPEPGEPRRLEVDDRVTNIMDLPPATRPGNTAAPAGGAVRTASYEPPVDTTGSVEIGSPPPAAKAPAVRNRYGYDSGYKWLKGQLEYSKAARRWKLRYIPLDGETDEHGGSVILADSPALAQFQAGDYVLVEGQVSGPDDQNSKTFSPLYRISRIDRIKR